MVQAPVKMAARALHVGLTPGFGVFRLYFVMKLLGVEQRLVPALSEVQ